LPHVTEDKSSSLTPGFLLEYLGTVNEKQSERFQQDIQVFYQEFGMNQ